MKCSNARVVWVIEHPVYEEEHCSPSLVSPLLLWSDLMDAEDDVHGDPLLVCCLGMQGAAQREVQLLRRHIQELHSS